MAGKGVISMHLQKNYEHIFENNHVWATAQSEKDPEFFKKLTQGQSPEYLWIGCSDSYIPAEQVTSRLAFNSTVNSTFSIYIELTSVRQFQFHFN